MNDLALIMPMAGRGSRFSRLGFREPKPLLDLNGRPFFWWATESVRRATGLRQLIFVVLDEHKLEFQIDDRIRGYYPDATVVSIPEVTAGAAETAVVGLSAVTDAGPVAINDCDQAFLCPAMRSIADELRGDATAALMTFASDSPSYSYVRFDTAGRIVGTVEKQVVSRSAIAGCYFFSDPDVLESAFTEFRTACPYDELFLSGIYNLLADRGDKILELGTTLHLPFGTPEELHRITPDALSALAHWK